MVKKKTETGEMVSLMYEDVKKLKGQRKCKVIDCFTL